MTTTETTTPAEILAGHLVVLARAGWRVDGLPALTALGAAWHDQPGAILLDGPAGPGITSLAQLQELLALMADSGWTAFPTGPTSGPWRTQLLHHDRHHPVPVVSRWHAGGVASVLTPSGLLVPPLHHQLLRRLYTIVSVPATTAAWAEAAVDTAALLDLADRLGIGGRPDGRLPQWVITSARERIATSLDADWPGHRPDDVQRRLLEFATTRP